MSRKMKRSIFLMEGSNIKCRRLCFDDEVTENEQQQEQQEQGNNDNNNGLQHPKNEKVEEKEVLQGLKQINDEFLITYKRPKHVHFASNQTIIEIPNRYDYFIAGIELWWTRYEMGVFYRDSLRSQF
mmetsp:Transcript_7745/g.8210  ORF Transcript_7745/g.8210 Transcript_7745/m.8210 type:complete len:127 (-) Transcript_7745:380-760(-)